MSTLKVKPTFIITAAAVLVILTLTLTYHYTHLTEKIFMCRAEINSSIKNGQAVIVKSYILNFYLGKQGKGSIALHGIYINVGQPSNIIERTMMFDYSWNNNYLLMKNITMYKNPVDTAPDDATPFSQNEVVKFEMLTDKTYLVSSFRPSFACNIR
ncbi:FidL [Brenneria sp. g21c3]|uniref:FidL n=1 Tax=Brenneria sp. g21c3 TaxID=3093893 RepID=UPI002EA6540D|nr:FidL [Brenneria sp. g21c3]